MHCLFNAVPIWVPMQAPLRVGRRVGLCIARFLLPSVLCVVFVFPAYAQDSLREEDEFHGMGTEINVTVHDSTGQPISSVAMVTAFRDGTIPSAQAQTTRGRAALVVTNLGEFTVIVSAPGYADQQKDVSVRVAGRTQVDVYLRQASPGGSTVGVPGRPLLAPKAKEAVDKGLQALSAEKMADAGKYLSEASRLAPGHPDVLYAEGVLRLKQRDWTHAQTALEKATQIDPGHARAFAALGMALCDQGKYDEAINPLERSLQLDAVGTWETRWALAKAYYQAARYDEALKMSQQALAESSGKQPEIALLEAQCLTAVGRYEDAAQVLREFLNDHADSPEAAKARRWLERLTASGRIRSR
jgi:Tfp pilus assembly protein PilF